MLTTLNTTLADAAVWMLSTLAWPLLIWTLLAWAGHTLLKRHSSLPPAVRYALSSALFYALPIAVLLSIMGLTFGLALPFEAASGGSRSIFPGDPVPGGVPEAAMAAPALWQFVAGWIGAGMALIAAIRVGLLFASTRQLQKLFGAWRQHPEDEVLHSVRTHLGLPNRIALRWSNASVPPMTIGWARPLIVVPDTLKTDLAGLKLAVAHEWTHVRHMDYLRRWVDLLLTRLFFFHPLVHTYAQQLSDYRELTCDAEVLRLQHPPTKRYAELLYSFSSLAPHPALPRTAVAMQGHDFNQLKTRITAMNTHASSRSWSQPTVLFSSLALLFALVAVSACNRDTVSEDLTESELVVQENQAVAEFDVAPVLVGGLAGFQQRLKYPEIAKKAGIEGRVFVKLVVDASGNVTSAEVQKGIGGGCDEEVLRALSETKFEPAIKGGKAVAAELFLPVTFKLPTENSTQVPE